jgi:hypothetical protein
VEEHVQRSGGAVMVAQWQLSGQLGSSAVAALEFAHCVHSATSHLDCAAKWVRGGCAIASMW